MNIALIQLITSGSIPPTRAPKRTIMKGNKMADLEKSDSDIAWDMWFDTQSEFCSKVDNLFDLLTDGKSDGYKAAVWTALIEHVSEEMRRYLVLPGPEGGGADVVRNPSQP
jgi:hypothetical protein